MARIQYRPTADLPDGVPVLLADDGDQVIILCDQAATAAELCDALSGVVTVFARAWQRACERSA